MPEKKVRRGGGNRRALALVDEINDELKLTSPVRLGSDSYFTIVRVPSGSLVIDRITGGGFALGRHYELFGDEGVGKSYIVYRTMALSQQRGKVCAIIDPEHAFDSERFSFLGGYPNELLAYHPQTGEEAVAVMMLLAKHSKLREIEIISCDSVASLVSTDEASKDPRDTDKIAAQARMMSKALRRITSVNDKTLFLWTNQEYTNVGVTFGNPNIAKGGRAMRYYATGRLEFRRGAAVTEKKSRVKGTKIIEATDVKVGNWVQVRAVKEKSTRPFREGAFVFNYEMRRIDPASEIMHLGMVDELIQRKGSRQFSYIDLDDKVWKGNEKKFASYLRNNEMLAEELSSAIEDISRSGDG